MKKILVILMVIVFAATITTIASTDVSDYTSGSELGKTLVKGTLRITNEKEAGRDSAKATTTSLITGTIVVKLIIKCTDANGNVVEGRGEGGTISSTTATCTADAPTGSHAFRATSSHTYMGTGYGHFAQSDSTSF